MLSKDEIVKLNDRMLQLGAPDERDDIGYNKPDYALMFNLAFIPPNELKDEYIAVMLNVLNHYNNTQLADYRSEIAETYNYYRNKLLMEGNKNFLKYIAERDVSFLKGANAEYIPNNMKKTLHYNVISVVGYNMKGLLLDFEDTNTAHKFKNQNEGVYYKRTNDGWKLFVPYDKLQEFVEIMGKTKKAGIDGYVPSEQLKEILSDIPAFIVKVAKQEETQKKNNEIEKKTVKLVHNNPEKDEIEVHFKIYSPEMNEYKNMHRNKIKTVKFLEEWHTVIKYDLVDEWCRKSEQAGLYLSKELNTLREKIRKTIEERRLQHKNRHANPYQLIDLNTIKLPFKPYDFQIEDAKRLLERDRMLMGHDMGCGKTFIACLVGSSIKGRKLVVCPETLRLNWKKEISNIGKEANIIYNDDEFHISPNEDSFTIVGYRTAYQFKEQLKNAGFTCMFIDEAHNCKAVDSYGKPNSQRAESVMEIAEKVPYVYPMTGTPVPTRNKDVYNILKILDTEEFDFNKDYAFFRFARRYCDAYNEGYGWDFNGNSNSDELHEILSKYMVRRIKKEVLPDLEKQRICIPLEIYNPAYKEIEERIIYPEEGDTYMGLAMTGRRLLSESKVKAAIEIAESLLAEDKSVVIVSNFDDTLKTIKEHFKDDCFVIKGGMKDIERENAKEGFQNGQYKVCALNIVAGGVGITLTRAHNMIICDYDWTPGVMVQVEDRICRSGQTEPCIINYLYGDGCLIDEIFIEMITDKNANIDKVVDGTENTLNLRDLPKKSYKELKDTKAETQEKESDKKLEDKSYFEILKERAEKNTRRTKRFSKRVSKIKNEV